MTQPIEDPQAQLNVQSAPDPAPLWDIMRNVIYKRGWQIYLQTVDRGQSCAGLTLTIDLTTTDSYDPASRITVRHYFPVPAAAYNRSSWMRWLFERILDVERHEAMEFFIVTETVTEMTNDDVQEGQSHVRLVEREVRPYAPNHGEGECPYTIRELNTIERQSKKFTEK